MLVGPYVSLAVICERVLQEKDGVLSLVRIIDRVMVATTDQNAPAELPEGGKIIVTLVVALKSGNAKGRYPIAIVVEPPHGVATTANAVDVMFEGEDRGVNLILNLQLEAIEGLYWFVVSIRDQELTRVPLRVMYQRLGASS